MTRLHPRDKGGPEGTLVWKTFKSLKLSSDRVPQNDVRWNGQSNQSKMWYYESFISVYRHSFYHSWSVWIFAKGMWRRFLKKKRLKEKLDRYLVRSLKICTVQLFALRRVYEGKNHVTRARCRRWNGCFSRTDADGRTPETDMDFLNVCHTKAPSGQ